MRRDWSGFRFAAASVVVAAALLAGIFLALDLIPPKTVRMAAGAPGGAYHAIAERYRALFARDGLTLEIVETAGSVENAALIGSGAVDAALLQGGIATPDDAPVEALAAVFQEPFLLFEGAHASGAADPAAWAGRRVAIGAEGSGTRAAVLHALEALGLDVPETALRPLGGGAAADALLAQEVDVAVFVAPIDAPYLAPLLASEAVRLAGIRDVEALERRLPYVRRVALPAASLDYAARRPPQPIVMPAAVATLAARADLHPALVDRFVHAARRVHGGADLLTPEGAFPRVAGLSLPLNAQAEALLLEGPPPFDGLAALLGDRADQPAGDPDRAARGAGPAPAADAARHL
jgi:TRAP transporter TAXI family solute receptor